MNLTILKLGGSVITNKGQDRPEIDHRALTRLADEVSQALSRKKMGLIIVHGAGPFGHVPAKKYGLSKGLRNADQVRGMALTHQSMQRLNSLVVDALVGAGVNAISYQPSAGGILQDGMLVSFPVESLERLLLLGLVPVTYGDVLPDLKTGLNILSGDHIVPYLAMKLAASRVIIATSHNGVFDRNPEEKGAVKLDLIDERVVLALDSRQTKGTDVTGGIGRKVRELIDLGRHGVESEIISGNDEGYVKRALLGESGIGTVIR